MNFSSPSATPPGQSERPADRDAEPAHVYSQSFDRETFRGRYATREAAREAGELALPKWPGPAEAIYVGRVIDPAPPLDKLAPVLIETLRQRGSAEAVAAIDAIGDSAIGDLDDRLTRLVRAWLAVHDVFGEARIEEISEHPLPLVEKAPESDTPEIGILGFD